MSGSHLTQEGTSLELGLRPKVSVDKYRLADKSHGERPWIRTGLAKLPPELIHLVCGQLCRCWYCEPKPYPLIYLRDGFVAFRNDLDSLSKTCRFLCAVAQPYLFHDIESPSPDYLMRTFKGRNDRTNRRLLKTLESKVPHLANHVRRITVNSINTELSLLRRLTGLWSLRVPAFEPGGRGLESYLSFPCLRVLHYGPLLTFPTYQSFRGYRARIKDAGRDLRAVLTAAPSLSHLSCHRLWHNVFVSPFIPLKLPACQITTLELHECWLSRDTFIRFMANFPRLKTFRLWRTMCLCLADLSNESEVYTFPPDGPGRIADAADVVEALDPCKKSLERLELDFGSRHESDPCFRFLPSMRTFTSLKTLYLTQGAIGNHQCADDVPEDAFTRLLTSSIEELQITRFGEPYRLAILDLAEQTAAGAYPNLAHVRLIGRDYDESRVLGFINGQAFLTFASGQGISQLPPGLSRILTYMMWASIGRTESTDQLLIDEEREEEVEHQEASEEDGSDPFRITDFHYDWVRFGQRCVNYNDFTSQIARCVKDNSVILLTTALRYLTVRKRIQRVFSKEFVEFECAAVEIQDGVHRRKVAYL